MEVDPLSICILKLDCQVTDMISPARTQLHHDTGRTEDDATSPQCEFVAVLSQGGILLNVTLTGICNKTGFMRESTSVPGAA